MPIKLLESGDVGEGDKGEEGEGWEVLLQISGLVAVSGEYRSWVAAKEVSGGGEQGLCQVLGADFDVTQD